MTRDSQRLRVSPGVDPAPRPACVARHPSPARRLTVAGLFAVALARPVAADVAPLSWCGTGEDSASHAVRGGLAAQAAVCPQRGRCDDPETRDATAVVPRTLRVIAHVLRSPDGTCSLSETSVRTVFDRLNTAFADNAAGLTFQLTAIRVHVDSLAQLPACDTPECRNVSEAILLSRALFSEQPEVQCNVVFSCLASSSSRVLLGVGNLPWSGQAVLAGGGIWLNASVILSHPDVLPHEMGHVLGLEHTHRGVSEVACSDACAELARDPDADRRGDFASDTPATPVNYTCSEPAGRDCAGNTWPPTQPENLMGYAPSSCSRRFTPQQIRRMHCWSRDVLARWFVESGSAPDHPLAVRAIPNPASTGVDIAFTLPAAGRARIEVFDLFGRRVARLPDADFGAGSHYLRWTGVTDGGGRPRPGLYVVRVSSGANRGHVTLAWR